MNGYLYIATGNKFIKESLTSAKSVKLHSSLPIAIVTTQKMMDTFDLTLFDKVLIVNELENYTYLSKIIGMLHTPFDNTIFLDSDTFVCDDISDLFNLLDVFDIATTLEEKKHTSTFAEMKYKNIFPELNSGVIVYRKNDAMITLLNDWFDICKDLNIVFDMPGLRIAVLKNIHNIRHTIIPQEYNAHGFNSFLILNGKVKVIHERLGTSWKTITPHFLDFDKMQQFSKKINNISIKRLYIPLCGIVPYNWNFNHIILKIKRIIGIKRVSKNRG